MAPRFSAMYQVTCPRCLKRYIGKIDRCFHIRIYEPTRTPDQLMLRHLKTCSYFAGLGQLCSSPYDSKTVDIDLKEHLMMQF